MRARTRLSTNETNVRDATRDDARRDATVRRFARPPLDARASRARRRRRRPTDRAQPPTERNHRRFDSIRFERSLGDASMEYENQRVVSITFVYCLQCVYESMTQNNVY